ncbi:MAG: SGNH/GDSL hydrolase family protein [PVC group bacterium]
MKRSLRLQLLTLALALAAGALICEGVVRMMTDSDPDGQIYLRGERLFPYRIPLRRIGRLLEERENSRENAYIIPDPALGWTIAPFGSVEAGLYRANSRGIRSRPKEYSLDPPPGVLRIALFGDSFTHGDEEPYVQTWGHLLEDELRKRGIEAEVINFGVPAYGIGQAYLRWKLLGRGFAPRVAVFGFQVENIKRTINIFRVFYSASSGLPFSKPRFVLTRTGDLELVNSPVIPPEKIVETLRDFPRSPLARYEYWFNPKSYSSAFWFRSRLACLIRTLFPPASPDRQEADGWLEPGGETVRLILAILERFAREVEASGGTPIILNIPAKSELKNFQKGIRSYYFLFRELEQAGIPVVDPVPMMAGKHGLYKKGGHFSSRGGRIVADTLVDTIIRLIDTAPFRSATASGAGESGRLSVGKETEKTGSPALE